MVFLKKISPAGNRVQWPHRFSASFFGVPNRPRNAAFRLLRAHPTETQRCRAGNHWKLGRVAA